MSLDAIVVKVRDNQVVQNKPAYIAIGTGGRRRRWRQTRQRGKRPSEGRGGTAR